MAYYLLKLLPPRPTFPFDMTDPERELMQKHSEYWQMFTDKGAVIAVGPVLDPDGPWGVGIIEVDDDNAAQTLADNDPVVKGNAGFRSVIMPMPSLILRKSAEK
jgi:uncharacterized protein YciI